MVGCVGCCVFFNFQLIKVTEITKAENQPLIKQMYMCQIFICGVQSEIERVRQKIWTPNCAYLKLEGPNAHT